MSFLDNLENNLKAMESLETGGLDDRKRREAERERAVASAPWAERLKKSSYVGKLMRDLTREGFPRRMKVNFAWIERVLRVEAFDERLELRPTPTCVEAVFAGRRVPVDLEGEPDALIHDWLEILDQKRERAAEAAGLAEIEDED